MGRGSVHIACVLSGALVLSGCGFADSHAMLPEFMRVKEFDPPSADPPPDIKQLVRDKLDAVFVTNSYPQNVQVSPPHHEVRGLGWTACVRAELTAANGKPLGIQTYRISISEGQIMDRKRADPEDNCTSESYEPI
ncbi:hypothetical protein [Bradyrhizobium sp.]|uniref:hypothetical protein n=1 Tax=Bradyrhizobium sp. TaxID=376 RepID=UPI003C6F92B9